MHFFPNEGNIYNYIYMGQCFCVFECCKGQSRSNEGVIAMELNSIESLENKYMCIYIYLFSSIYKLSIEFKSTAVSPSLLRD